MRFVVVMWACICGGRSASAPTGRPSATCSSRTTAASTGSRGRRCWSTSAARTSSTSTGCAGWRPRSRASPTATAAAPLPGSAGEFEVDRVAAVGRGVAAGRALEAAGCRSRAARRARRAALSAPMSSGCCSRWSPTARSTRARSSPPPSGPARTRTSPAWRRWTRTRPTARWTCWSRPTRRPRCRRRCSSPTADLLNLEVDLLFFDTTSTYFERDEPDPAGEDGAPAFRAYGHSKDHRPDLPQVVIGLAVTREGIPVRVWVWPGNTNDMSVIQRGQGRPQRLAARPGRHRRRPRL